MNCLTYGQTIEFITMTRKGMKSLFTKESLERVVLRRVPVISFIRHYNVSKCVGDIIAAFSMVLTLIPQSMAVAAVAGMPTQYGLYSAFMSCFVYTILGTTPNNSVGPTLTQGVLVLPFVLEFGTDAAILICFFSGCIITLMAIFKLGFLVDLVSAPVLAGFMSGASLTVIAGQVAPFLGFSSNGSSTTLQYVENLVKHITMTKLWDTVLGVSCIIFLHLVQYISKFSEIPKDKKISTWERIGYMALRYLGLSRNALVIIICTGIISSLVAPDGSTPVAITGDIEQGLPPFKPPPFIVHRGNETLNAWEAMAGLSPALIIPIIILLEVIAVVQTFAQSRIVDMKQEMIAVGVSNICGSFFLSMQVAPSLIRSSINNMSGAKTTLGGIFAGSLVLIVISLLTSSLKYLPSATLAAVIICSIYPLLQLHNDTIRIWRSQKRELFPLYLTFFLSLVLGLGLGMIVAIAINILVILYDTGTPQLTFQNVEFKDSSDISQDCSISVIDSNSVILVSVDRGLAYPSAERIRRSVNKRILINRPKIVLFDGKNVSHIDFTAAKALNSLTQDLNLEKVETIFWNWNEKCTSILLRQSDLSRLHFQTTDSLDSLISKLQISKENLNTKDHVSIIGNMFV